MGKSSIQELRKNGSFEQLICIQEKLKLFSMRMSKSDLLNLMRLASYAIRLFSDEAPFRKKWWAWLDSNQRPRAYQARALTN